MDSPERTLLVAFTPCHESADGAAKHISLSSASLQSTLKINLHHLLGLLKLGIRTLQLARLQTGFLTRRIRRDNILGALLQHGHPTQLPRHEFCAFIVGRARVDADLFAEAFELDDVGGDDGAAVAHYEGGVLADHVEPVGVEDDEHALGAGDGERSFGKGLHVGFAAEAGTDDEDVQTGEDGFEFGFYFVG